MNYSIKLQKKENPTSHLTIIQKFDNDKFKYLNQFTINVTSGTVENPSKLPNATWWNLGDKYHTLDEVHSILKRYGIEEENALNNFARDINN